MHHSLSATAGVYRCVGFGWDRLHFLQSSCMVLCFIFVLKIVLIIWGCYRYC